MKGVKAGSSNSCKLLFFIIISEYFNCHCSATITLIDTTRHLIISSGYEKCSVKDSKSPLESLFVMICVTLI